MTSKPIHRTWHGSEWCGQNTRNPEREKDKTYPASLAEAACVMAQVRSNDVSVDSESEYSYPSLLTRGTKRAYTRYQWNESTEVHTNIPCGMHSGDQQVVGVPTRSKPSQQDFQKFQTKRDLNVIQSGELRDTMEATKRHKCWVEKGHDAYILSPLSTRPQGLRRCST